MDKRIEKNIENVNNIKSLLMHIISNTEMGLVEFPDIYNDIKTQHSLAALESERFNIKASSLNTLKRTSIKVFENGFDELEKLRQLAVEKIESYLNKSNKQTINKEDKIKQLENEIQNLEKIHLVCLNQLMEDLSTFNNIKNMNNIDLVKLISEKSVSKIRNIGLFSDKLIDLSKDNHLKVIK